jgi:nitroreductase
MTTPHITAFQTLLSQRQSCRAFLDHPVARAQVQEIIEDAQKVPSWCNSQPWQVFLTDGTQTRDLATALFDHSATAPHASDIPFPTRYEGPYKERRRSCGWQLYDAVGIEKGDRAGSLRQMRENYRLFGAPNFMLVTSPKALGPYGALDCGAFVTAFLLGLQARGLGGIAMASVAGFSPFMRDWFTVPDDRDILCGIAFGHPDHSHPANSFRTERAPFAGVATWKEG